ncbi:hypothetical protein [Pseudonocardia sp.]|jgi:hypothetical protein|uniref:hypothetical protein n=1 Tax=Pseudonocardia sp. TaxID=60912 RepID=UPI003D0FBBCB
MDTDSPAPAADRSPFLTMLTTTPDTASEPVHVVWHPRYRSLLGHRVRRDVAGESGSDPRG